MSEAKALLDIARMIRESEYPLAEAGKWLTRCTNEITKVLRELDASSPSQGELMVARVITQVTYYAYCPDCGFVKEGFNDDKAAQYAADRHNLYNHEREN